MTSRARARDQDKSANLQTSQSYAAENKAANLPVYSVGVTQGKASANLQTPPKLRKFAQLASLGDFLQICRRLQQWPATHAPAR